MADPQKLKLSRLRNIGWSRWDPIGLLDKGAQWEGQPFADEYDTYLVRAASQLRNGAQLAEVVDYLITIESEHMGLGLRAGVRERAVHTVDGISAYVAELESDSDNVK